MPSASLPPSLSLSLSRARARRGLRFRGGEIDDTSSFQIDSIGARGPAQIEIQFPRAFQLSELAGRGTGDGGSFSYFLRRSGAIGRYRRIRDEAQPRLDNNGDILRARIEASRRACSGEHGMGTRRERERERERERGGEGEGVGGREGRRGSAC
jgi:hypothetical protein